jgi:hypothetical protein
MKTTIKRSFSTAVPMTLMTLALSTAFGQTTNVISIQLMPWSGAPNQPLAPGDSTGAFPATNWNPLVVVNPGGQPPPNNWTQQTYQLNDNTGASTAAQLVVLGVNDGWFINDPPPDSAPITKLLNTFPKTDQTDSTLPNTLGQGLMQFVFTNLIDTQTYDVYVYLMTDWGGSYLDVDAGTGVTNYVGPELTSVNQNSTFIQAVSTTAGTYSVGNYVRFNGLASVNAQITVSINYDPINPSGNSIGVCGFQLVPANLDRVAPVITTQPASQTVYTNASATFTLAGIGYPTPGIRWYEVAGGATNLIAGATNLSYTTSPVTINTNGTQYYAVFSNAVGTATSSTATLTVLAGFAGVLSVQLMPNTPDWAYFPWRGAGNTPSPFQPLLAADSTGAFPATNWNPLVVSSVSDGSNWTAQTYQLEDDMGVGSAVKLRVLGVSDGNVINDPPPDSAPITKLLNTFVKTYPAQAVSPPNELGMGLMQFEFTNLNGAQTYDAYVYLMNDPSDQNAYLDVDAGTGVTNYVGPELTSANENSTFIQAVSTTAGSYSSADFVRLTGITPVNGQITVSVNYDYFSTTASGVGVSGLQLVVSSADSNSIWLVAQPLSQRVLTNTPATFVVAPYLWPVNAQWYQVADGATNVIPGATNVSYTTSPVSDAMTGTGYFVLLSSYFYASVTSHVATLTAGHLIGPVNGFLENDQYFANYPDASNALSTLRPGAAPGTPNNVEYLGSSGKFAPGTLIQRDSDGRDGPARSGA